MAVSTEVPRPSRRTMIQSVAPGGIFLVTNALVGVTIGVILASLASLAVIAVRRATGSPIGLVLPVTVGYVMVRGVAGASTGSEDVYFAIGLAASALFASAIFASAFTRNPAGLHAIPLFVQYSPHTVEHRLYRRVAAQVTAAWAVGELAVTSWEASHLTDVGANEFIALRAFVGWPFMFAVIFVLIFYVRFRLDHLETGLSPKIPAADCDSRGLPQEFWRNQEGLNSTGVPSTAIGQRSNI